MAHAFSDNMKCLDTVLIGLIATLKKFIDDSLERYKIFVVRCVGWILPSQYNSIIVFCQ